MSAPKFLTITEQVAAHLRNEILRGRWSTTMPGRNQLAPELGVNRKTAEAALRQLEHEGILVGRGAGSKRLIVLPEGASALRPLQVAILDYDPLGQTEGYKSELRHLLEEAGHHAFIAPSSLTELGMKVSRVRRLVERTQADAWIVCAGSRQVLEWFASRPEPTFALFGRRAEVAVAATGPDKPSSYAAATRQLIELGHRRIALLCREERRLPAPGATERAFLATLEEHGIPTGDFNLPNWEDSKDGFQKLLDELFRVTPPTALLVDETHLFSATQQFLARRKLQVPEDVSLVCSDPNPDFTWCEPSIAHIRWDPRPVIRRIVRWAANVSRGKPDVRQSLVPAEFVAGGTIGPAAP